MALWKIPFNYPGTSKIAQVPITYLFSMRPSPQGWCFTFDDWIRHFSFQSASTCILIAFHTVSLEHTTQVWVGTFLAALAHFEGRKESRFFLIIAILNIKVRKHVTCQKQGSKNIRWLKDPMVAVYILEGQNTKHDDTSWRRVVGVS